jgi:GTPase
VDKILNELGVADRPRLHVLNKMDRLSEEQRAALKPASVHDASAGDEHSAGSSVFVSALTGEGIEELLRRMDTALPTDPVVPLSLRVPLAEGRTLSLVHALGRVLHSEIQDSHMLLDAEVPASIARRLRLNAYAANGTSRPAGA